MPEIAETEQLELIETKHPKAKAVADLVAKIRAQDKKRSAAQEEAHELRKELTELLEKIDPPDGRFVGSDFVVVMEEGETTVRIAKRKPDQPSE